jgi:hypothetical protein
MDEERPLTREFSGEELSEIIRRAARREKDNPRPQKISYEDMLQVGRELGIDSGLLAVAAEEVAAKRKKRRRAISRKLDFYRHLTVYISVIFGLMCINLLTDKNELWFLYPAIGWGMFVAIQGMSAFFVEKESSLNDEYADTAGIK